MSSKPPGTFQVAVEAIIEKDGQILVTKRGPNRDHMPNEWEMITGRVDQGESFEAALHREVFEETQLKIEPIQPVDTFHFYRGAEKVEMVGVSYWCRYVSGEVVLEPTEQVEYKWVNPEQALEIIHIENIQKTIQSYIALSQKLTFTTAINHTQKLTAQFPTQYSKQDRMLDAMEEMGELAQAMLMVEKRKTTNDPTKQKTVDDIADALCDVLYNLILLAGDYGIDYEDSYQDMLKRLQDRLDKGEFKLKG